MREKRKMCPACLGCPENIGDFGVCRKRHDNWYFRKTKKNGCPKCDKTKNKKPENTEQKKTDIFPVPEGPTEYTVYTDGGCAVNPGGPGGYGAVMLDMDTGEILEFSQGFISTTSNRMEMMGVLVSLEKAKEGDVLHIFSDSQYVINTMQGLWQKKKNRDLWEKIDRASRGKKIDLHWVKGHNGDLLNEKCDQLATEAIQSGGKIIDTGYDEY